MWGQIMKAQNATLDLKLYASGEGYIVKKEMLNILK